MRAHLQRLLLNGAGLVAEACARPKAALENGVCWLQYPLQVRGQTNGSSELLVFGTMFTDMRAAARFERTHLVPLALRWWNRRSPLPRITGTIDELGIALSVFPVNGPLPRLVEVVDPQRMTEVVRSIVSGEEHAAVTGIDLVRFRRTRGCVLRYRFEPGGDHEVIYGKVGYAGEAEVVRQGLDALARHLRCDNGGSVLLPRVLGHSTDLDLTLVSDVPGSRPDLRVASVLEAVVDGAASVAASMHASGIPVGRARTMETELARAADAVELIRADAPALAGWLTDIVDALRTVAPQTPAQQPAFAHGDFTLSQLMFAGSRTALLDFDKLCEAEPAFDLGRFLAYLRFVLAKFDNNSGDALASRFLATYSAAGGRPTSVARVDVYMIASLVRMAARSWLQLKPARLRLAFTVLEAQVARLGLLPG